MIKAKSSRRGKHYLPEVALARGPQNMGTVGDASYSALYGRNWVLVLDRADKKLHLYQESETTWNEVPIPDIPHDGREIRHISVCFDQSARHVMAYERAGQVWVRQWDVVAGAWTMRGPFPGVDPVLIQDTTVGFYQPDSDVLLFYLTPDRKGLRMRVQRELYAVEHSLESYSSEKILDQALSLPYQFELVGEGLNVRSEIYPVYLPTDQLATPSFSPGVGGNYRPIVIVTDGGLDVLSSATIALGPTGNYRPVVVIADLGSDDLSTLTFAPGANGNYRAVVVVQDVSTPVDALSTASFAVGVTGNYRVVVQVVDLSGNVDVLSTGTFSAPAGGNYVAI